MKNILKSNQGSALVNALIFSGMMMVASGVMMYQSLQTQQLSRMPRVRSEIDRIEARVREIALDPTTYSGCKTVDSSSADIPNTCTINQSLMTDLDSRIAGCKKADGSSCGIKITNISLDNATGVFKAEINYEGKEIPLRPSRIEMPIPKDILQADVVYCPLDKPLFRGFDAKGKLICEALKNPELCNLPGQYIKDIDALYFSVTSCSSLSALPDGCPANQYMSSFSWPGGPTFIKQCADRKDPWELFNYTPVTNKGTAKENGFLALAPLKSPTTPQVSCVDIPVVVPPGPTPTATPTASPVVASTPTGPSVTCGGGSTTQSSPDGSNSCSYTWPTKNSGESIVVDGTNGGRIEATCQSNGIWNYLWTCPNKNASTCPGGNVTIPSADASNSCRFWFAIANEGEAMRITDSSGGGTGSGTCMKNSGWNATWDCPNLVAKSCPAGVYTVYSPDKTQSCQFAWPLTNGGESYSGTGTPAGTISATCDKATGVWTGLSYDCPNKVFACIDGDMELLNANGNGIPTRCPGGAGSTGNTCLKCELRTCNGGTWGPWTTHTIPNTPQGCYPLTKSI